MLTRPSATKTNRKKHAPQDETATAAKGDAKITVSGSDVDAPFVVDNGTLYAVLTAGKWDNFGPAANIYYPSLILNPDTGVANLLAKIANPKSDSRETINGQDTIKITGTAPVDAVNGLVPQLNATQPLPATMWIQENGDHQLVQARLDQSPGNSIQMTLSNWNAPVQVTQPPSERMTPTHKAHKAIADFHGV